MEIRVPAGSTMKQVLEEAKISLSPLDRTEPSLLTTVENGSSLKIIRVTERFDIVESILPFDHQTVKNESITEGQSILIQSGVNGMVQSTFRVMLEDGLEVSRTIVKKEIIQPAKPEIVMIGVQSPFSAVPIEGVVAYITSSNAWIMENNTGNRRVLISTGDLDGRIFTLSYDRKWLLFSRMENSGEDEAINSLWIIDIIDPEAQPIDTGIRNVVHSADWVPGKTRTISYSTAEPRSIAPGWQANNDLILFRFDENGKPNDNKKLVEINSGGQYGWWGTLYIWSPDGSQLVYSRPDSIGQVNITTGEMKPIIDFTPYQPKSDWAWIPGVSWSEDSKLLYTTLTESGSNNNGDSNDYSLTAVILSENRIVSLVSGCGLFCYPIPSPSNSKGNFLVGYLSAIIPDQSETSRYSLRIMDRDGSNQIKLYPGEGLPGLEPQTIAWSPESDSPARWLVFIAQGNIFMVDSIERSIHQVTGDGSITKIAWR